MSEPVSGAAPSEVPRAAYVAPLVPPALAGAVLLAEGRVAWCKCGSFVPWSFDIWTQHNSQHLIDPYSATHVLHGVVFFALLAAPGLAWARWRSVPLVAKATAAVAIESVWELVENSNFVIEKYRAATISLDYYGDSVANSMSDVAMCGLGFAIASRLPWWASLAFFVGVELLLLATIHDSLIINVIMLIYPVEAIKQWQLAASAPG